MVAALREEELGYPAARGVLIFARASQREPAGSRRKSQQAEGCPNSSSLIPPNAGRSYVLRVPQRDLFADFARMRREMDQMMGDAWGRGRYVARRSSGFSPNVDVYYCGDPQQAVVKVDLAGVELSEVGIEVSGRHLAIVGERPVQETEGRVYQQVEIPSGPFRRIVELQVEVDAERAKATYEDGMLKIELPLRDPSETTRRVPIGRK
jgi:HSP20 family protein